MNEIAQKVTEKNKNNEFDEPLTNSAEMGIISQKDFFDREIVNEDNLSGYYVVRNNDFVYNPRVSVTAPVGPINRNKLGRIGVMSPLYTVFRTHDINTIYLEYYYKTTRWHRFMKLNGDSGARFDRFTISSTQFMEMPIPYPSIEEQEKIGYYFAQLDHLITLHQRKCTNMVNFNTITWEQRKVCDMFEERNEQYVMCEEYPLMAFIANVGVAPKGERYDRSALIHDEVGKKYKRTEKGDFIYSSNNLEAGSIGLNNYGNACISPVYSIFKSKNNADSDFLGRMLLRKDFINAMIKFRQGVVYGQWKIHEQDFLNLEILVPLLSEQHKIGKYFSHLDHLITLHQCKCFKNKKYVVFDMLQRKPI